MKAMYTLKPLRAPLFLVLILALRVQAFSQSCPTTSTTNLAGNFPNTYYPATQASAPSGTSTITLGAVPTGFGTHAIQAGDILLLIQMQGSGLSTSNSSTYGDGTGTGSGYMNNSDLMAGNMEFIVASSSVPTSGGTLTTKNPLYYSYKNQAYNGSYGQYTYQVIYVPAYYNLTLGSNINVPSWNGSSGGVIVLAVTDVLNFNSYTINAAGAGFRGGGSRQLSGGSGTSTEYESMSTVNNNGGKGEGLSGTPRFINSNGTLLDNGSTVEGYPSGAEARGAPGNAGGGGTDYDPSQNDQNSGGGGGGNGGIGGQGGNSWSTNQPVGGVGGAAFAQASPTRLVLGGGGGGGTTNNGTGGDNGFYSSGVSGGGIVIIYAGSITGTGTINVNGTNGYTGVQNDASGGGGAGGSVLIFNNAKTAISGLTVTANGGNGGSNTGAGASHGPGGGGGGGIVYSNVTIGTVSATPGVAGTTAGSINYGATSGNVGSITQNATSPQMPTFPMNCTLLPVNFISFTAQPASGNVTLDWTVETQTATGYVVERSFDGNNFDQIANVAVGQNDNASINSYTYIDNNANSPTGTIFYRIMEQDVTGQVFYSTIVTVKTSGTAAGAGIYPNPAKESFTVTFTSSAAEAVSLRLFDLSGRLILTKPVQAATGVNAVTVDGLGTLPEGMYILQWFDGLKPWTSKVMIRH